MERQGEMAFEEAKVWMDGIYGLMALCGLKPGDLLKGERDFQDLPQRLNKRFRAIFLCA
jgi:hypothetical protein